MRHLFELRDIGVHVIERETFESSLELSRATLAAITGDPARAKRAVRAFARHDADVLAKLYAVHKNDLDANISASNELRAQFARTLREDEEALAARRQDPAGRPAE
jgi:glutathione-regulated potassium-efflux system ancillary protein KefC